MTGNQRHEVGALAALRSHDVDRERAAHIREACHRSLGRRAGRLAPPGRLAIPLARVVEPALVTALLGVYLSDVLARVVSLYGR